MIINCRSQSLHVRLILMMLVLSLVVATRPGICSAQYWDAQRRPPVTGKADSDLAPIDQLMEDFLVANQIPGAAVAVSRHGTIVYARGFGWADVDQKQPVQPRSLFRIASNTKPFTATAIMQLVDQKKLTLDAKAFSLLPFEPKTLGDRPVEPRLASITILELLQHRGGWDRDKSFDPMFRSGTIAKLAGVAPPARQQDVINYMMGTPLDFAPGSRYAYSNFGYCVLGRVIEKISGKTYEEFVKESVLKPLGITDMKIGHTRLADRADGEVLYYDHQNRKGPSVFPQDRGQQVPNPYGGWYLEAMDSHGGWIASAPDSLRMAMAYDDPDHSPLISAASAHAMFARPPGAAGATPTGTPAPSYYGFGWEVRPQPGAGRFNAWHNGLLPGCSALLVRRSDGIDWAILFNTDGGADGQAPAAKIDAPMHTAVNAVKRWPTAAVQLP
jgi:N-acyl-D-amino-acid deacylase